MSITLPEDLNESDVKRILRDSKTCLEAQRQLRLERQDVKELAARYEIAEKFERNRERIILAHSENHKKTN